MNAIENHVNLIQEHERASAELRVVEQGKEGPEFWRALKLPERPENPYQQVKEWYQLDIDVSVPN